MRNSWLETGRVSKALSGLSQGYTAHKQWIDTRWTAHHCTVSWSLEASLFTSRLNSVVNVLAQLKNRQWERLVLWRARQHSRHADSLVSARGRLRCGRNIAGDNATRLSRKGSLGGAPDILRVKTRCNLRSKRQIDFNINRTVVFTHSLGDAHQQKGIFGRRAWYSEVKNTL